ncbi:MAG: hypothetical protein ACYCXG_00270 [Acidiferrobacter sp.]
MWRAALKLEPEEVVECRANEGAVFGPGLDFYRYPLAIGQCNPFFWHATNSLALARGLLESP